MISSIKLHIGIGAGRLLVGQMGGLDGRWKYVVAGDAVVHMNRARKEAKEMEIVISKVVGDMARMLEKVSNGKHTAY